MSGKHYMYQIIQGALISPCILKFSTILFTQATDFISILIIFNHFFLGFCP